MSGERETKRKKKRREREEEREREMPRKVVGHRNMNQQR